MTIPSTGPYTVTPAKAVWVADYGVRDGLTGVPATKTASAPATGQYSCGTTGVLTFAAADAGLTRTITYSYTTTGGWNMVMANQLQGQAPVFQVALQQTYLNKVYAIQLYACTSTKLTMPTKMEDYMISDFEFSAFANSAGNIGKTSFPE